MGTRWVVAGVAVVALAVGGVLVAGDDDPPDDGVRVAAEPAPPPSTAPPEAAPPETYVMGAVGDVDVAVAPRTGLVDGELVTLTVEGADGLPDDAIVLMCTGEVRGEVSTSAIAGCDSEAVTRPDGTSRPDVAEGEQQVAVSRFLRVAQGADLNERTPYDCATEPAGCVLVLAPFRLPPTAVAVPLGFDATPVALPTASAVPASGLADGQVVTVEAAGLRPRAAHQVGQCVPVEGGGVQPWSCDWATYVAATTDADGRLRAEVPVHAALYPTDGRVDCTATACSLVVMSATTAVADAAVGIGFAPGVVAPTPVLALDPPGPYADGQEVTIRGTGFPAGRDLSGDLGLCPADRDTRVEERCTYDLDPVVVAPDGTFAASRSVHATTGGGACADTGCVIGWVIPKGATVAPVPIEFSP